MSIWTKRSCEATGHHLRSALSATLDKSGVWACLDEWNARHIPAWLNWCQKLKWSPAALVVLWHAVWDEYTNTNTDKTVNAIWLLRAPYRGTGPEREQVVARVGEEQERWREAWNERKQDLTVGLQRHGPPPAQYLLLIGRQVADIVPKQRQGARTSSNCASVSSFSHVNFAVLHYTETLDSTETTCDERLLANAKS